MKRLSDMFRRPYTPAQATAKPAHPFKAIPMFLSLCHLPRPPSHIPSLYLLSQDPHRGIVNQDLQVNHSTSSTRIFRTISNSFKVVLRKETKKTTTTTVVDIRLTSIAVVAVFQRYLLRFNRSLSLHYNQQHLALKPTTPPFSTLVIDTNFSLLCNLEKLKVYQISFLTVIPRIRQCPE